MQDKPTSNAGNRHRVRIIPPQPSRNNSYIGPGDATIYFKIYSQYIPRKLIGIK